MNVLLISDFYPPQVGGMERHVESLARELRRQGHEVAVATTGAMEAREERDGIVVHQFRGTAQRLSFVYSSESRRYPPPFVDPELSRKLARCIDEVRPDVVHVHGWTVYSVIAANSRRRVPLVVTLHDYGHFCCKRTLLRDGGSCARGRGPHCIGCAASEYGHTKALGVYLGIAAGLRQLRNVDEFIAVSTYVKEQTLSHIPGASIHVIPNFLDPSALAIERDRDARSQLPSRYVAFVGVLAPFKGVDDLITAFKCARETSQRMSDFELWLFGRFEPPAWYESEPESRIRVVVDPPRGLVVEAIAGCRCLVVPSRWAEPCPTVVLEGVASGRPVIGTRVGGIPELLEGVPNARLVPAHRPDELAGVLDDVCGSAEPDAPWEMAGGYLPLEPARVVRRIVDVYERARSRNSTVREGHHG